VQTVIGQDRRDKEVDVGHWPTLNEGGVDGQVSDEVKRLAKLRTLDGDLHLEVAARIGVETVGHWLDFEFVGVQAQRITRGIPGDGHGHNVGGEGRSDAEEH